MFLLTFAIVFYSFLLLKFWAEAGIAISNALFDDTDQSFNTTKLEGPASLESQPIVQPAISLALHRHHDAIGLKIQRRQPGSSLDTADEPAQLSKRGLSADYNMKQEMARSLSKGDATVADLEDFLSMHPEEARWRVVSTVPRWRAAWSRTHQSAPERPVLVDEFEAVAEALGVPNVGRDLVALSGVHVSSADRPHVNALFGVGTASTGTPHGADTSRL